MVSACPVMVASRNRVVSSCHAVVASRNRVIASRNAVVFMFSVDSDMVSLMVQCNQAQIRKQPIEFH